MALIEAARAARPESQEVIVFNTIYVRPGSVTAALEALRMGRKLDRHRETARMALEPWIVEAALDRLERPLTPEDQRIVLAATRTPWKVRWPDWWEATTG